MWPRKAPMTDGFEAVGLLRSRANCCLFTWRERRPSDGTKGERTVEIDDGHCDACVAELRRLAPEALFIDRRERGPAKPSDSRVLVVDDDADIREELTSSLCQMGCEVVCASNGKEALEYLRANLEHLPRLILLDLMMPTMDGTEFLERQREDPALANIPIVVITAKPELPKVSTAGLLRKPFRMDALAGVVDRQRGKAR